MGSLQWSQCLSPPFLFALRNWSPCLRHLLSLQPVKSSLDFRLTRSSAHRTSPPREGQGAHPLQMRPLLFRGPADAKPTPREPGVLEAPALPRWRGGGAHFPSPPIPARGPPALALTGRAARRLPRQRSAGYGALTPAAFSPAGRRPERAAAPRPQGNRREPMTDGRPAERGPPSTQPGPPAN